MYCRRTSFAWALAVLVVGIGAGVAGADYMSAVMSDNPLAYYRFDGDTVAEGQTVIDETGSNDGVYVRTQVGKVAGPALLGVTGNQAYSAQGVSNAPFANVGTLPGFGSSIVSGATVEFWINSSQTTNKNVLGTYSDSSNNWFLATDRNPITGGAADDHIRNFASWQAGGPAYDTDITDGTWNYVAIVMNYGAADASERLKIYMADEGDESVTQLTGLALPNQTTNDTEFLTDVLIGVVNINGAASTSGFGGLIDEVAFYGSALTEAQLNTRFVPEPGSAGLFVASMMFCLRRRRR